MPELVLGAAGTVLAGALAGLLVGGAVGAEYRGATLEEDGVAVYAGPAEDGRGAAPLKVERNGPDVVGPVEVAGAGDEFGHAPRDAGGVMEVVGPGQALPAAGGAMGFAVVPPAAGAGSEIDGGTAPDPADGSWMDGGAHPAEEDGASGGGW